MPSSRKSSSTKPASQAEVRADNPDTDIAPVPMWLWPLLWIGCVAIAFALQPNSNQQRVENSLKLKVLKNEAEQARIAANYGVYKALPDEERNRYRQFHQELIASIGTSPDLGLTLDDYCDWVRKLSQEDRDRLHKATDAQSKLKAIEDIRTRQARQRQQWLEAMSPDPRANQDIMARGLSAEDLAAVLTALDPYLKQRMSPERYGKLAGKPLLEKCFVVFKDGFDEVRSGRPTPPKEVYDALEAAISDPRQKRLLNEQATQEGKWWALLSLVRSGIRNELMRYKPTPEELASVEEGLKEDDRRRLERAPPDVRGRYLMFLVQQRKFPALKDYMDQMFRREGWGGRFPGGPGGPGRDGGPRGEGGRPPGPGFGPGEGGRGFDKDRGPDGDRKPGRPEGGRPEGGPGDRPEGGPFGNRPFRDRRPGEGDDRPPPPPREGDDRPPPRPPRDD
jgi:hypothetical protein